MGGQESLDTKRWGDHIEQWVTWEVDFFRSKYNSEVVSCIEFDKHHPFLDELQEAFDKELVGQTKAKKYLSEVILKNVLRFWEQKWPLGVMFFHWPTGVWKTEIVRVLWKVLFQDPNAILKVNCENYSEKHVAASLFWAPPWYVWHDTVPVFNNKSIVSAFDTAKQLKKLHPIIEHFPWVNILLLDEVEKAHADVHQQLLSLLDEGRVQLHNGELVNFENTIVILSSNLWQREIKDLMNRNTIGFTSTSQDEKWTDAEKVFKKALWEKFSPEFIGRIHNFIEFETLTPQNCKEIIEIQLRRLNQYIKKYFLTADIQCEFSPKIYEFIIKNGYSSEKWARDLVRFYDENIKTCIERLFHAQNFQKYLNSSDPVILGIDLDENNQVKFVIIHSTNSVSHDIHIKEMREKSFVEPRNLKELYEFCSSMQAYVETQHMMLEENIDLSDELNKYAQILEEWWLTQIEIAWLKHNAHYKSLRDLNFLSSFEGILMVEEWNEHIFAPHSQNTIEKFVSKKIEQVLWVEWASISNRVVSRILQDVFHYLEHKLFLKELDREQTNQVIFYFHKTLVEKFNYTYK